jgi:hypothetical protein
MILRVDDYPAGIRPIQPGQLDMFDRMIEVLPTIHLGIVPVTYMRYQHWITQSNVIPCMHGWEHGYIQKSELLKDDPYNHDTIGVFDEFDGYGDEDILFSLISGKKYLEKAFEREVDTFIPCCNTIDTRLTTIIHQAGFTRILCENVVVSPILIIRSGFYGRLEDLTKRHEVTTIHLPWEWDTVREVGFDNWAKLVKDKRDANFI